MVNFCQDPPRLAPPYSIARLAGIETDEKLEEKEVKEGGGEERVDSSESDEPKVKITTERNWHQTSPVHFQVGSGMDLFPESGKKGFRLRKGHKEERAGGKVEFDSKKVSHSTPAKIFKFSHNLNVFKESNALHFAKYHS